MIAFANQKGGVAKTTTALNLAVAFKESGHRVLAVDMDPQGNLTMSQGIDPDKVEKSMFDVLVHGMPLREVIVEREIDVAVASIDLAGAEIAMSAQIGRERALQKAIDEVRDDYDFVCIDTPPSLGLLTVNALTAADKVIVPGPVRVPLDARPRPASEHASDDPREPQPRRRDRGDPADDARLADRPRQGGGRDPRGELRRPRLQVADPQGDQVRRGARPRQLGAQVRPEGKAAKYYRDLAEEVLTHGS